MELAASTTGVCLKSGYHEPAWVVVDGEPDINQGPAEVQTLQVTLVEVAGPP